jgi:nitrate reductase beta subunit
MAAPVGKASRVNLLNWDGKGSPSGLFPPPSHGPGPVEPGATPDTTDDGATGEGGTGGLTGGADVR